MKAHTLSQLLSPRLLARMRRALSFLKHPDRFLSYATLKLAYRGKWLFVPVLPTRIDVEPINVCNFRCEHCQVTHWNKQKAQLDLDSFRKLLNQMPRLEEIKLQGMGEPLLNKQFIDLLKEGEGRGITMHFHSNASAVTPANADRLLELQDTSIVFSIDGACAETFERVRPGSNFERIRNNIRHLTSKRGAKRAPKIQAWTVVTQDNVKEIPEVVRLCAELGFDRVTLQPFLTAWGKEEMNQFVDTRKVDAHVHTSSAALSNARLAASAGGIDFDIVSNVVYSRSNACAWPWERTYIAANGDVVPCCIIADADVAKMGNVFDQPLTEIWNGPAYRELRERVRSNNLPDYCRACYVHEEQPSSMDLKPPQSAKAASITPARDAVSSA